MKKENITFKKTLPDIRRLQTFGLTESHRKKENEENQESQTDAKRQRSKLAAL